MSKIIDAIESRAGVSIGKVGEPKAPFLTSLQEKSLPVPKPMWVWRARAGRTKGKGYFNSLSLATAEGENSRKKDALYHRIVAEAVLLRTHGEGAYIGRYAAKGYLAEAADNLTLSVITFRECIRAMRIDLVYGYQPDKNKAFSQFFISVAEEFLKANTDSLPSTLRPKMAVRLDMEWNRESPATFYRTTYRLVGKQSRAIGIWMPYEAEVLQRYYQDRVRTGSSPSVFDLGVINKKLKTGQDRVEFAKQINQETGIYVERHLLTTHRNALLYGNPTITIPKA